MLDRALRLERLFRVGIVHLAYGVIVLATVYVVVPIVGWWQSVGDGRALLMQRGLHRAAALFRRLVIGLDVIDVSFVGAERLTEPGALLAVANHPTHLDATFMVSVVPQLDHVADAKWMGHPILGGAIAAGGHLFNDDPRRVIEEGARRLAAGRRLVIFPEGTRSPVGALHPFHRGAARIALAAGCDLVPIVIRCDPPFGKKDQPWYEVPRETPRMSYTVGAPISPGDIIDPGDRPGVAARKITNVLEEYFRRELEYPPSSGRRDIVTAA